MQLTAPHRIVTRNTACTYVTLECDDHSDAAHGWLRHTQRMPSPRTQPKEQEQLQYLLNSKQPARLRRRLHKQAWHNKTAKQRTFNSRQDVGAHPLMTDNMLSTDPDTRCNSRSADVVLVLSTASSIEAGAHTTTGCCVDCVAPSAICSAGRSSNRRSQPFEQQGPNVLRVRCFAMTR
jgi:hypothetical protein